MKLDLSKLKHVKSDDKTTTLQHKDGHQITLAHSALSKSNQAALKALSGIATDAQTSGEAGEARQAKQVAANPQSLSNNGFGAITSSNKPMSDVDKVIRKAEGGQVSTPKDAPSDEQAPGCTTRVSAKFGNTTVCDAEGGEVEKPKSTPSEAAPGCTMIRADKGWGAVYQCDAEGGEVLHPPNAKFCPGCGKPNNAKSVHEYAKGGAVDEDPLNVGSTISQSLNNPASATPSEGTPDLDNKEKAYNDAVINQRSRKNIGSDAPLGLVTEHSVAPDNVNPDVMQHALAQDAWDTNDKDTTKAQTEATAAKTADLSAKMGFKSAPSSQPAQPDVSGAFQEADANRMPTDVTGAKPSAGAGSMDPQAQYNEGMAEKNQANTDVAEAAQTKSLTDAKTLNDDHIAQQAITDKYQSEYNGLNQEREHLQADVNNGHVDPNKFWDGDKTTGDAGHSRIMAAIGMIVAGFNPTTRPNAAIEYLNAEMDRNLKAQERNLSSKENLLNVNLRQFGNLKDATDMARIQQRDMVANQLAAAAAVAQGPQAKAAALAAAGQMSQDASAKTHEFAMQRMMRGLMSDAGGDSTKTEATIRGMNMMGMSQGKTLSDAYVPGYGTTKTLSAVPAEIRSRLTTGNLLMDSLQDLQTYADTHTNLVPGTPSYKEGVAKSVMAAQRIREAMLGGVMKAADAPILDNLLGQNNPAGLLKALTTDPKIKAIFKATSMSQDRVAHDAGLSPRQTNLQRTQGASSGGMQQQAAQWAQAHPNDPRAAQILQRLGK